MIIHVFAKLIVKKKEESESIPAEKSYPQLHKRFCILVKGYWLTVGLSGSIVANLFTGLVTRDYETY